MAPLLSVMNATHHVVHYRCTRTEFDHGVVCWLVAAQLHGLNGGFPSVGPPQVPQV